jgi:predicted metal-dependent peptidase
MTPQAKIAIARIELAKRFPQWARLAFGCEDELNPEIPTACTDSTRHYWNPAFVDGLTVGQAMFVKAHGGFHDALGHSVRRGERDHDLWNRACDYAINSELEAAGFDLISGALLDKRFAGMAAEAIYATLAREQEDPKRDRDQQGNGAPEPGDQPGQVIDRPGNAPDGGATEQEQAAAREQAKRALADFARIAKERGELSATMDSAIRRMIAPPIDWRSELADWVDSVATAAQSWTRPNRSILWHSGLIAPTAHEPAIGEIVIALDASGSVTDSEFGQYVAQCAQLVAAWRPIAVHVLQFDDGVVEHLTGLDGDMPEVKFRRACGGTAFQPVFDYLEAKSIAPRGVIFLTDLWGDRPRDPGYPVLWVSTDPRAPNPEFGRRVDML